VLFCPSCLNGGRVHVEQRPAMIGMNDPVRAAKARRLTSRHEKRRAQQRSALTRPPGRHVSTRCRITNSCPQITEVGARHSTAAPDQGWPSMIPEALIISALVIFERPL